MKTKVFCLFCLLLGISTASAFGQEWTKAQLDVWQVCEKTWENWKIGNIDGIAAVTHPKYQGWDDQTPLPYTKEKILQQFNEWENSTSINSYDIEPARIVVTENAAVIDYYYYYSATVTRDEKKETRERNGMFVEFYVKEKGNWFLLADMTTHQDK